MENHVYTFALYLTVLYLKIISIQPKASFTNTDEHEDAFVIVVVVTRNSFVWNDHAHTDAIVTTVNAVNVTTDASITNASSIDEQ